MRVVAKDWAEYDRLLRRFDRGKGPEPEGPHADLSGERSTAVIPVSKNWVSWFGGDGIARHYGTDTAIGREIERRLIEAESGRLCPAPKALFPNRQCGNRITGRKGKKYCSLACKRRALRT